MDPVLDHDANQLYVVSGFSTPAMVLHHAEHLKNLKKHIRISLIIGIVQSTTDFIKNGNAFCNLVENELKGYFSCHCVKGLPYVHSKVYAWYKNEDPILAYVGSANYTQNAFIRKTQLEAMGSASPLDVKNYYDEQLERSILCSELQPELVDLGPSLHVAKEADIYIPDNLSNLEKASTSLLAKAGESPPKSGLNWGQREGREPNQAYIPLRVPLTHSDFFPPIGIHFTVYTDDNKIFICVRAQANGKAIETPHNNSSLGLYFRKRLGVEKDAFVAKSDILNYGRHDVDFYKIDDETYYMDFSVNGAKSKT